MKCIFKAWGNAHDCLESMISGLRNSEKKILEGFKRGRGYHLMAGSQEVSTVAYGKKFRIEMTKMEFEALECLREFSTKSTEDGKGVRFLFSYFEYDLEEAFEVLLSRPIYIGPEEEADRSDRLELSTECRLKGIRLK